jgi:hypothetical protein
VLLASAARTHCQCCCASRGGGRLGWRMGAGVVSRVSHVKEEEWEGWGRLALLAGGGRDQSRGGPCCCN